MSRPFHVSVRPKRLMVIAVAKPTRAADIRGWTAKETDKGMHVWNRDGLHSGAPQNSSKVRYPSG